VDQGKFLFEQGLELLKIYASGKQRIKKGEWRVCTLSPLLSIYIFVNVSAIRKTQNVNHKKKNVFIKHLLLELHTLCPLFRPRSHFLPRLANRLQMAGNDVLLRSRYDQLVLLMRIKNCNNEKKQRIAEQVEPW
jgi:hypothetical protein